MPCQAGKWYKCTKRAQFLLKYEKLYQPLGGGVEFPTFQQDAEFNWDFIVSNVTKEG
jgi:hypothetical protein